MPQHSGKSSEKNGFRQTNTHTHTLSGHQWLCSKFPFKGSPQDRLCTNIIQGPFEVHTWNVFWLGCCEWHLSPLGYWRGEALLGRLEVERKHLVVPAASLHHISHILKYTGSSSPHRLTTAAKRYKRCSRFLPDKAWVHFGVDFNKSSVALSHSGVSLVHTFLCRRSCSEGRSGPHFIGGVKPRWVESEI